MKQIIITGLVGVATGFLGALLKSWLDSRLKLDADTRKERWNVYKKLWVLTGCVPKWPRNEELNYGALLAFSGQCRDWYFTEGGYHFSRPSQKAYAGMQDAITDACSEKDPSNVVDKEDYKRVQKSCSALRTQLTQDLHSRQRGPFFHFGI